MDRLLHFLFDYCRLIATIARIAKRRYFRKRVSFQQLALWQYALYGLLITTFPRAVFFGQALKRGECEWAQLWEPVMWHASKNFALLTGNFFLCMAALPLLTAYIHFLFDFRVHRIYGTLMVHDLFVVNCKHLLENNSFLLPQLAQANFYSWTKTAVILYLDVWKGYYDKYFYLENLAYFPGLSKRIRVKAVIAALLLECATLLIIAAISIVGLGLAGQLLFNPITGFFYQNYSFVVYIRLVVEGALTIYAVFITITFLFWGIACAFLIKFVYERQLADLNLQMRIGFYRVSRWRMTPATYAALIRSYRWQHYTIWQSVYLCKIQLVDNGLLVLILTNVTLNVLLVSMFIFYKVNLTEQLVVLFALLVETLICCCGGVLMANFCDSLYSSGRYLHRATVFLFGIGRLPDKLKMMSYYEVIHSTHRLCFSIGNLFEIQKKHFFNYLILYTSYIFYVSKIVRKNSARELAIAERVLIE